MEKRRRQGIERITFNGVYAAASASNMPADQLFVALGPPSRLRAVGRLVSSRQFEAPRIMRAEQPLP
jgi:hypothetical protein